MKKLDIYLNFAGNTEEALNFYKSVFGGDFTAVRRFKDRPRGIGKVLKQEENRIFNISLPLGKENALMASDTLGSRGQRLIQGNNFYISIVPDTKKEADRIFKALSEDGRIILPISDQPWNAYYGSFADKYGVRWMVDYEYAAGEKKRKAAPGKKVKAFPVSKKKTKVKPPAVKRAAKSKLKPASTVKRKIKPKPGVKKPVKVIPVAKSKLLTRPALKKKKMPAPVQKNRQKAVIPARKFKPVHLKAPAKKRPQLAGALYTRGR